MYRACKTCGAKYAPGRCQDCGEPFAVPVYDAEFFEPSEKRQRALGLGWHIALLFVLLTAILVAVIGYLTIN